MFVLLIESLFYALRTRILLVVHHLFHREGDYAGRMYEAIGLASMYGAVYAWVPCPTWILGRQLSAAWRFEQAKVRMMYAELDLEDLRAELSALRASEH